MAGMANSNSRCVGICVGHTPPIPMIGSIITFSDDCIAKDGGAARVGDIVKGECGHIGIINTGSPTTSINNKQAATIGSTFTGVFSGTIVSGANDILVD